MLYIYIYIRIVIGSVPHAGKALSVRERMETFLSLYGNTLVREKDRRE